MCSDCSRPYGVPIAVFTDNLQKGPARDYWYPPILYLPLTKPKKHAQHLPAILHHVNHWATIDINRRPAYNMQWPPPYHQSVNALKSKYKNIEEPVKRFYPYLSIKKPSASSPHTSNFAEPIEIQDSD